MALQILLNVILSWIWMFFEGEFTALGFFTGYLLGLLIIYIMRRFFPGRFYLYRVFAVIKLTLIFLKELLLANIDVMKVVLKPKLDIQPGIFALETKLENDWEITLLSSLITLTPGTLVLDVSPDNKTLYIHAMDIQDVEAEIKGIQDSFEKAIMEVSR